jgi:23S rRNA A1618 N6-methylase RlmF
LVSSREHLLPLKRALAITGAMDVRVLALEHGQKKSRTLAWRFAL